MTGAGRAAKAVLFDKDGTLFSFQATLGGWTADLIDALAPDAPGGRHALARAIAFDAEARAFRPESPVIAGTLDDAVELMLPALAGWRRGDLRALLVRRSMDMRPVEAAPLAPLLRRLSAAGLALGVATNDAEAPTRAQLAGLGLGDAFGFVAGADSGHGAKPDPGPCRAFLAAAGVAPEAAVMVGDSLHDLHAGRAAGMRCVAVLTGPADRATLAPHADAVLADIGALPDWLGL